MGTSKRICRGTPAAAAALVTIALVIAAGCSTPGTPAPADSSASTPSASISSGAGSTTRAPSTTEPTVSARSTGTNSAPTSAKTDTTPPATGQLTRGTDVPTDLTGETYGYITTVDLERSTVTIDKVDYFSGAAAVQACAEDGVTETNNNWCTERYWRNNNPMLREVSVSPDATIVILVAGSPNEAVTDLGGLATRIDTTRLDSRSGNIFRMQVDGGQITRLAEMYSP